MSGFPKTPMTKRRRAESEEQPAEQGAAESPSQSPPSPQNSGPEKPKQATLKRGDLVFSPYTYGRDVMFEIVRPGAVLSFVIGDVFNEPTPILTAELQSLQDVVKDTKSLQSASAYVIRTAKKVHANDAGLLRLQMLNEGLERLRPAVEAAGIAAGFITYNALKGIVERVLKDRSSAREQRADYPYESSMFFDYN